MSVKHANVTSASANVRELRRDISVGDGTTKARRNTKVHEEEISLYTKDDRLRVLRRLRVFAVPAQRRLSSRQPSGGTTRRSDWSKPCAAIGSVATPPPLPTSPPPKISASLFRSSAYQPGSGTPMR